jgi:hypothetical protein
MDESSEENVDEAINQREDRWQRRISPEVLM